jgi:hypothetical protein
MHFALRQLLVIYIDIAAARVYISVGDKSMTYFLSRLLYLQTVNKQSTLFSA